MASFNDLTPEQMEKARACKNADELVQLASSEGVELSDGKTAPALVRVIERDPAQARVEITIHEGRNRQVRRMFEAVGSDVRALKRVAFARLTLAGVRRGAHRPLTAAEVAQLYELAGVER